MQQHKLPRDKIPWFPTVNYGDRECLEFCKNGVFSGDEAMGRPLVEHPRTIRRVAVSRAFHTCPVGGPS